MTDPILVDIEEVEKSLRPYARTIEARIRRFLGAFVPAFLVALVAGGHNLTWHVALAIAVSTALAVLAELDPSVPWSGIVKAIEDIRGGPSKSAWRNEL